MSTMIQFPGAGDEHTLTERVSQEVRSLMGRHQVTQTQLAAWLNLNQTAISARLRGATEWKVREIDSIAQAFGVHPAVLMGGQSEDRPGAPAGGVPIVVRHQGLEPRTRWFEASTSDRPTRHLSLVREGSAA